MKPVYKNSFSSLIHIETFILEVKMKSFQTDDKDNRKRVFRQNERQGHLRPVCECSVAAEGMKARDRQLLRGQPYNFCVNNSLWSQMCPASEPASASLQKQNSCAQEQNKNTYYTFRHPNRATHPSNRAKERLSHA